MKQITFEAIYTLGRLEFENELYKHIHYPDMLIRYDSNYIEFKRMPSLEEFKEAEHYLKEFHQRNAQNHLKFFFPENEEPDEEVRVHMEKAGYEVGFMELYAIDPANFSFRESSPDIDIREVTTENIDDFITLQYKEDVKIGEEFANQKTELNKRQFADKDILQVIAFYKGNPAGSVVIILSEGTAEIDSLSVDKAFQRKGIGASLQKFVMDSFPDKAVILVADGEDTPREMYRKQNYRYQGFMYEGLKIEES